MKIITKVCTNYLHQEIKEDLHLDVCVPLNSVVGVLILCITYQQPYNNYLKEPEVQCVLINVMQNNARQKEYNFLQ